VSQHKLAYLPQDGLPLHIKVAMALRSSIAKGEWKIGEELPPFGELAERYGVAMNTIRKAMHTIAAESLVHSHRGRGTRVIASVAAQPSSDFGIAISDPHAVTPDLAIKVLSSRRVDKLPTELAEGGDPATAYQRIYKTHTIRGTPFAVLEVYVAHHLYKQLPRNIEKSQRLIPSLRDVCHVKVIRSRQQMMVTHADQDLAKLLDYPIAAPLIRLRRWRVGSEGSVIFACTNMYRGDMFVWDVTENEPDADHFVGKAVLPSARLAEK